MKYGLIGEKLGHSFSKIIHEKLGYEYSLCEIDPSELDSFMKEKDFLGINVTIPYKEAVIPYLDEIDESARSIGAVNTIVNRGGQLKITGEEKNTEDTCTVLDSLCKMLAKGTKLCLFSARNFLNAANAVAAPREVWEKRGDFAQRAFGGREI